MTPEELALLIQLFLSLEPEVQKGIAGIVHIVSGANSTNAKIAAAEAALAAVQAQAGKPAS